MKNKFLPALLALGLAALPAFAGPGHGHSHAKQPDGPNKGRILAQLEPDAELFVTPERKVRLTFIDAHGKPVAIPEGFSATLVTGDRSAPVTLEFSREGKGGQSSLVTTAPLPEGQNLPAILRAKLTPEAAPLNIRVQLNLANCPECQRPEYACTCAH